MSDKIIQFPGQPPKKTDGQKPTTPVNLTDQQQKAIGCIMSGMAFVFVGIKPVPTGADFFTALHGDETDLRNAEDHLPGVIHRLYEREGLL